MKNILVIHHGAGCFDGFGAAFSAWLKFGDNADFYAADHGEAPPDVQGKHVYIIDFSYPRKVMLEIAEKAASLQVLDHHKSAEEDLRGLPFAVFDMAQSGAGMAWRYFHADKPMPALIRHVEDEDLFRFADPNTEAYCCALRTLPQDFKVWETLAAQADDEALALVCEGQVMLRKFDAEAARIQKNAVPCEVGGVRGMAVNAPLAFADKVATALAKDTGTFGLSWFYNAKGQIQCSFRSRGSFDVTQLAGLYGGGGHRNAAGARVNFTQLAELLTVSAPVEALA